ncbi:HAD family hydrolase [Candidatus Saccharibacteria bacterium]|nr:HAD family hydrolase [Candidatus Saccharibacteria bacterium]
MIEHIWFDFGGTLYKETSKFNSIHDKHRYAIYAGLTNQPDLRIAKRNYDKLYKKYGSNSATFRSLGVPSDYWMKEFEKLDLADLLKPNSEIINTLRVIKERVPISLFTNIRPAKIEDMLGKLEIPVDYFTHMLSGDDVKERKPHLEGFHKMVSLSELPADKIMYVGDRIDVDIKPAKQVGMVTCLVWSTSSVADYSAPSFGDLWEIVLRER